jgi:hypothetical protein
MSGIRRNPRVRLALLERAYSDRRKLGKARQTVLGCGCKPMCAVDVRCAIPYNIFTCVSQGLLDASQWMLKSPKYHGWILTKVQCFQGRFENYNSPNKT